MGFSSYMYNRDKFEKLMIPKANNAVMLVTDSFYRKEECIMSKRYPKIECIKDWMLKTADYSCEYIKGKKYKVCAVKPNFYNEKGYIDIETNTNIGGTWKGSFWSDSDYFNVDEYLKALTT